MKVVAAVFADFHETFLGGPSQLGTTLCSRPILAHTLHRLAQVAGVDARCLFVRERDAEAAHAAVADANLSDRFTILPGDDGARPRRDLIRSARKWNLCAWRGTPLGTTAFDEFVEPVQVARVLQHFRAEAALCLDGHQPVLDPGITSRLVEAQRERAADTRLAFTLAPPGVSGIVLTAELVRELVEQQIPVGLTTAYRPEVPKPDVITREMCVRIDPAVTQTPARLTGDTRRSRELLTEAFAALGEDCSAGELCAWVRRFDNARAGTLPVEVELELTTDDPLPETTLRPRGQCVPRRRLDDLSAIERRARELAQYDDRLVVLGGHGDPLVHSAFPDVCRMLRSAGVCGIAAATPLVEMSAEALGALIEARIDVLEVLLDANTPEVYRQVHGSDAFERVLGNVERVEAARQEHRSPQPIILASLTRCAATLPDQEAFFDRWIRATGGAVLRGYSAYCGQLPADTLLGTTPLVREPCRRLGRRLMLLADGTVPLCSQDFRASEPLANWIAQPLSEIWAGERLEAVRRAHSRLDLTALALCAECGDWHRP